MIYSAENSVKSVAKAKRYQDFFLPFHHRYLFGSDFKHEMIGLRLSYTRKELILYFPCISRDPPKSLLCGFTGTKGKKI